MSKTLVLHNLDTLVTMNAQREVLRHAFLVAEDGFITRIGTGKPPAIPDATVVNGKGGIALPGLINTHHHMFQNLARAYTPISNLPLLPWLAGHMPLWKNFSPDDLFIATQVALAELMLSGCTLSSDHHYLFPVHGPADILDAGFEAAETMGSRYVGCRGSVNNPSSIMPEWSCQPTDRILADCQRLYDKFHDAGRGSMRQVAFAPCTVFGCEATLYKETARLARKLKVRMHTHSGETIAENEDAVKTLGMRPLECLSAYEWEGDDIWLAHGIHFNDAEVAHLTRNRMGVAHCPCSNMRLGSGICRVNDLRRGGSPVSLGVDGSASNDSGHMLNEARLALLLTRVLHGAEAMTVEQALEMATLDGARNLGRTHDLGSLEVGKCADVAVFPAEDIWSNGAENKLHALLLCHARTVDSLIVHGKVRVADGQLVGIDLPKLLDHHRRIAARIHASV